MITHTIPQGDLQPALEQTLYSGELDSYGNKIPLDLTNTEVRFRMRPEVGTGPVIDRVATIVNATQGRVRHTWVAGDTDRPGKYRANWRVLYANGPQTVPTEGHFVVVVTPGLV